MIVRALCPGDGLAVGRDQPLVCLPWLGPAPARNATLRSVAAHTPEAVPVVLAGAGLEGDAANLERQAGVAASRELLLLEVAGDDFAGVLNAVGAASAPADLVVLAPGTRVGPEWLLRLRAAAYCDSTVVSATAFADRAGALSVTPLSAPGDGGEQRDEPPVDAAAGAVAGRSPRARPRIAGAGPHCAYLRRAALELVGSFDAAPGRPEAVMADFSLRASRRGMVHVAADDVYVRCRSPAAAPGGEAAERGEPVARFDEADALSEVDRCDERSVLRRSLAAARIALYGLSVTVDARALGPAVGGTQVYTIELILALARSGRARVRAVVPPDLSPAAASALSREPSITLVSYEQAVAGVTRDDVVHRPQQIFTVDDLNLLWLLGERVVIGHQDLIAYRNPAYHESLEAWQQYRRVSRLALAAADRVVFFSGHAERDALAEDLISHERSAVAGIGADGDWAPGAKPVAPGALTGDEDFLVCLGADYAHKNRPFAFALLKALRRHHAWEGQLVLAGAHVPFGSSREEELALLEADADLAAAVTDLGPVDEGVKAWLYKHARAVVYPSSYEGFGLVPLEAARAGSPCLFAPVAALAELAGPGTATLLPWDARASAEAAAPLLRDGPEREAHVQALRSAAAAARWSEVTEHLLQTYDAATVAPQRAATPRLRQDLERERYLATLGREAEDLRSALGVGLPLVARGGLLNQDEQRGLMRIAARRPLHRLLLGPVALLGRLANGAARSGAERSAEDAGEDESGPSAGGAG